MLGALPALGMLGSTMDFADPGSLALGLTSVGGMAGSLIGQSNTNTPYPGFGQGYTSNSNYPDGFGFGQSVSTSASLGSYLGVSTTAIGKGSQPFSVSTVAASASSTTSSSSQASYGSVSDAYQAGYNDARNAILSGQITPGQAGYQAAYQQYVSNAYGASGDCSGAQAFGGVQAVGGGGSVGFSGGAAGGPGFVGTYGYGGPQGYSYGSYPGSVYDYTAGPLSYPAVRGGFGGGEFQNFPGQPGNGGFHFGEQQIQGPGYSGFASDQGAFETATSTGPTGYGTVSSAVGFDNANGWLTAQQAAPYAAAAGYGYQNPPQQGCYGYQGNPSATASVLGGYQSGAVAGPYSYAVASNDGGAGAAWAAANGQFPSFSVDLSGAYASAVAQMQGAQAQQAQAQATSQAQAQAQAQAYGAQAQAFSTQAPAYTPTPFTYDPSAGSGATYGAAAAVTPTSTTAPSAGQVPVYGGPAVPSTGTSTSTGGSSSGGSGGGSSDDTKK